MYGRTDLLPVDLDPAFGAAAQLRSKWAVQFEQPLLLISQIQRSGGHLLAWLFDSHPDCLVYPHELKWGRPKKYNWPSFDLHSGLNADNLFELLDEDWPIDCARRGGFFRKSKVTNDPADFEEPVYPFVFDVELRRELFRRFLSEPQKRRDVLNAFVSSYFNSWIDYQGVYLPKRWVVAFIPRIVQSQDSLAGFFTDYPDGHLVSIIRHPGSWYASAKGRSYAKASMWKKATKAALQAAETHPDKISVIMFEDLVQNTREVMEFLCSRIGIAFNPSMLSPTYNGMPMLSNSTHEPTTSVDKSSTERYLSVLSPAEIASIEQELLPLYRKAQVRYGLAKPGYKTLQQLSGRSASMLHRLRSHVLKK